MNRNKQTRKKILSVLSYLCLIEFIIVAALLIFQFVKDETAKAEAAKVRENIENTRAADSTDNDNESAYADTTVTETPAEENITEEITPEIFPEMAEAQAINSDIMAILDVGSETCLYVTQGEDNSYYLTHNYKKEEEQSGAAFLDYRCQLDPRDTHWIIYGHNMRSGIIFGQLADYRKLEYLKENPMVYLTLTYEKETYIPYAILDVNVDPEADNYFKITEWNFDTDESFESYVNYFKENSYFTIPVEVTPEDTLLTLCTCSYVYSDSRFLIACRKLREDETETDLIALIQEASAK